ncbi:hypothetical protein TCAL_03347 [Tigriopus californicus]|uniref:STI1 domain-containing protein n=1 Tax=Tigriopus californicus TaxID=6832 RepID=A0A553P7D9_TIGCA|nr:hsc70-interacting protein-like [Tigriopus californicus]TRY73595.1 hypothetical protein TCAL_03347 [Tigriopus californicus]
MSSSSGSPFSSAQIQQLRQFVDALKLKPEFLYDPQLGFLRDYLISLGAVLPQVQASAPTEPRGTPMDQSATPEAQPEVQPSADEPETEAEDPESEVELDMTGVIEPDEDETQPMGDPAKGELTEEDEAQFSGKRSEALAAFSEGEWSQAIDIFTEAIILNPHNAVVFAKRGACFLKLQKPQACIRDCDRAIELNPDSAPAYKNRGRAHRLLGNFLEAARDLRQACKIDFDEQTDEWLKEVTPNAKKLEDHERKKARRNEEREIKAKKERLRKAQEAREKAAKEASSGPGATGSMPGGMPGGMPGAGGAGAGGAGLPGGLGDLLNDPELMGALSDPEVATAFQDIMSNPANIMKYQNNPRIMKLIEKMAKGMGGGIPGMGGMPGGMGGMPGGMGGMPGGMGGMPGGMGGMPGGMGGFGAGAPGAEPSSGGGANATPKPPSATDDLD